MPFFKRYLIAAGLILFVMESTSQAVVPRSFSTGVGFLSHGLNRVAQAPTGETSLLGTSYYNLDFQMHFPLWDEWHFSPRIVWMPEFLYPTRAPNSSVKTSFLILGLPVTYNLSSNFDFSGGLALIQYNIAGPGGTTTLQNGNGTSTFALPGRSESSKTLGLLLGASYNSGSYRVSLDTMTEGATSNSKRTFSLMLTLSYSLFLF